jgi:hypothetical protein
MTHLSIGIPHLHLIIHKANLVQCCHVLKKEPLILDFLFFMKHSFNMCFGLETSFLDFKTFNFDHFY